MKQIRRNVFETNSSSTHSIAIPKKCETPNNLSFATGDFGWSFDEVDAVNYFYTAIYETSNSEIEVLEKIQKLKSILKSHNIEYHISSPRSHTSDYDGTEYFYLDDGYIDHGYELQDFVDELLNDEDKLLRFLGGGLVFTGNDNSDTEERCFINRDEEYLECYDWDTHKTYPIKNPYYMSNHEDYDWYYKGN
jgi:hypothetical protein